MVNRKTPIKKRSQSCYNNKVKKITDWYERLIKYRKENPIVINPNTKLEAKRKELKPLEFFIDKIKKSNEKG